MKKINILFVAPYPEIALLAAQAAKSRSDVRVSVEVANLSGVLPLVCFAQAAQYDIVISRGGTGRLLTEKLSIPTVLVELSGYDVLQLIQTVRIYQGRAAMVCFSDLAQAASRICALLQYEMEICEIGSREEAEVQIHALKEQGVSLIVGDVISTQIAQEQGLRTILATSGMESIQKAFDEAVRLHRLLERSGALHRHSLNLLAMQKGISLVLDEDGHSPLSTREVDEGVLSALRATLPLLTEKGALSGVTETLPVNYAYNGKYTPGTPGAYYFTLQSMPARTLRRTSGFSVLNPGADAPVSLAAFLDRSAAMREALSEARRACRSLQPVMLYGSVGTEREALAKAIHWDGILSNAPMFRIDALQSCESVWRTLLKSENSPLLETHFSLLIVNFQELPIHVQGMLLQFLRETRLTQRSRVFCISDRSPMQLMHHDGFLPDLVEMLSVLTIRTPDLRERREDLQSLLSLSLSACSQTSGRNPAGFTPAALQLLLTYNWPYNLPQLRRLVRQCAAECGENAAVSEEIVRSALEREEDVRQPIGLGSISLNGTLDAIETRILQQVLEEENRNQARAAKRLGISRTTLWRKIRRSGGEA